MNIDDLEHEQLKSAQGELFSRFLLNFQEFLVKFNGFSGECLKHF